MKKLCTAVLALTCGIACTFSFVACNNDPTSHSHRWSETYTLDGDRHYQTCDGCNEKKYGEHSYNADGVCVCGKQKPAQGEEVEPNPELKTMNEYFLGVKVAENKTAISDADGSTKTFEDVLDRQFDVLAQDILYRLYLVYGADTHGTASKFQDLNLNYSYNGNSAKVIKSKVLTDLTKHDTSLTHTNVHIGNIDCIYCYQSAIMDEAYNRLNRIEYIMLSKAVHGEFHAMYDGTLALVSDMRYEDTDGDGNPDTAVPVFDPTPYKWLFNDYSQWDTDYRTAFKLELAKVVYGDENTNLTYNEMLAKINNTGFSADTEEKIVNAIYKTVIGENLIAENLRIYNTFSERDKSQLINWTEASEIEKHYFKGYNITVPAIVKQALANTFENTSVSLYPVISRQSVTVNNSFNPISVMGNTLGVTLMSKANTPVTKLAFEIGGTAGQTVNLNFDIVSNGVKHTVTKAVTLTAEPQTVEVDFSSAGVKSLNAFNGNTNSYTSNALFNNTDGADTNGENYIAVDLSDNDKSFTITFLGIYDK